MQPERPQPIPISPPRRPADACEICGGPTLELHCKIQCRNCGYTRDCSDP